MDRRFNQGPVIAGLLVVVGLVLWSCIPSGPCGELECGAYVAPLHTRAAVLESTLRAVETRASELEAACGGLYDACCPAATAAAGSVGLTATPWPTYTPRPTWVPLPTYTPAPSATYAPVLCRRCVVSGMLASEDEFGCPDGYVCEICETCYALCVPADSPRAGCNFCAGMVIP